MTHSDAVGKPTTSIANSPSQEASSREWGSPQACCRKIRRELSSFLKSREATTSPRPPFSHYREKNHWEISQSGSGGRSAVEAIEVFIARSPGCSQGTILAPVAAWRQLPGSKKGPNRPRGFGSATRSQGCVEVTSAATQTKAWHEERLRNTRRAVADQANALRSRSRA
jgi:hypothetical protein